MLYLLRKGLLKVENRDKRSFIKKYNKVGYLRCLFYLIHLFLLGGCTLIDQMLPIVLPPPLENMQLGAGLSITQPLPSDQYKCNQRNYPMNSVELLGSQPQEVQMVDDNHVEIKLWVYRPVRTALKQGQPLPTPPPDGFDKRYLPTDYEIYHYNLVTNELKQIDLPLPLLSRDLCHGNCEKQVLDKSPNGEWVLVAVKYAWSEWYNGLWLVHKDYYQRLIVPFDANEHYRSSWAQWHWQNDSTGLYLSYRTAGERPTVPVYIRLSMPPAYSFLLEGVHFAPGMFSSESFAISDSTILLNVKGSIIKNDGQKVLQQWYIYDSLRGILREAALTDFSVLARYVFTEEADGSHLIKWSPLQQDRWLDAQPGKDIWNSLGESALFREPYITQKRIILIPKLLAKEKMFQIVKCISVAESN